MSKNALHFVQVIVKGKRVANGTQRRSINTYSILARNVLRKPLIKELINER